MWPARSCPFHLECQTILAPATPHSGTRYSVLGPRCAAARRPRYAVPPCLVFPKGSISLVGEEKKGIGVIYYILKYYCIVNKAALLKNSRTPQRPEPPLLLGRQKNGLCPPSLCKANHPHRVCCHEPGRPTRFAVAPRLRPDPAYAPVQTVMDHQPGAGIPDQEIGATLWGAGRYYYISLPDALSPLHPLTFKILDTPASAIACDPKGGKVQSMALPRGASSQFINCDPTFFSFNTWYKTCARRQASWKAVGSMCAASSTLSML